MTSEGDKPIIELAAKRQELAEEVVEEAKSAPLTMKRDLRCMHVGVVIDEQSGEVLCRSCQVRLEPILVLLEYARRERRFLGTVENWKRIRADLDDLRAEEKRLRARVGRLRRKESELACLRGNYRLLPRGGDTAGS